MCRLKFWGFRRCTLGSCLRLVSGETVEEGSLVEVLLEVDRILRSLSLLCIAILFSGSSLSRLDQSWRRRSICPVVHILWLSFASKYSVRDRLDVRRRDSLGRIKSLSWSLLGCSSMWLMKASLNFFLPCRRYRSCL